MEFPKFTFHHTTLKQMELLNEDTLWYGKDSSRHAKAISIDGLIMFIMHSLLTKSRHAEQQDFHHSIFYMALTQSYHWISSKLHTSYLDSPPTCLHQIFLHYKSSSFKVTRQHWQSHWNTPLIMLEEQSSIQTMIQAQIMARWIQDRRFSTRTEFQSGERVRLEDKTSISWTIWSFMTHSRWILHSQGNGWHCISTRSCCILTFTISCSRRHSPSYRWLTFG